MEILYESAGVTVTFLYDCEIETLIRVFEEIATEEGWQPDGQIREYGSNSVFFAALVDGQIAGGLKLVVANGRDPMPASHVWPEIELRDRTDVAHAAILALKSEYRGHDGLFGSLCVEMWRYCVASRIKEIYLECVPKNLTLYRRIGWPLEVVGKLRTHWGEKCYLCRMGTDDVARSLCDKALRSEGTSKLVSQASRGGVVPALAA